MHHLETKNRFIELRAQGRSLEFIGQELQVSRSTLIAWQHRYQHHIANLHGALLEQLHEKVLPAYDLELSRLTDQLNKVEAVLAGRKFIYLPTKDLFAHARALRAQIRKQTLTPTFTDPQAIPTLDSPDPDPAPAPADPAAPQPDPSI